MSKEVRGLLIRLVLLAGAIFVLLFFVVGFHIYHGNNMAPWMRDGDLVIISKLQTPAAGSVAGYRADGAFRFGRIIAAGGDTVDITEEHYLVNGAVPQEAVYYDTLPAVDGVSYPFTVPEGSFFILNDMREDTDDSRVFGSVSAADVEGVVFFTMSRRGF